MTVRHPQRTAPPSRCAESVVNSERGQAARHCDAYFAISGYRLVKDGLHQVGAFRLLRGAKPHAGTDVGLRPNAQALKISSEETELSSCGT
jgi:hypothetical protein